MIDVTKIRIGNVVEYLVEDEVDPRKKYWLPNVIDVEDILWLSQNPNDENYRYMKLTEKEVLDFGFSDEDYVCGIFGRDFKDGGMILDFVIRKPYELGEWNDTFTFPMKLHRFIKLEFAHELQNLFLDCTGEKLEFSQDVKFETSHMIKKSLQYIDGKFMLNGQIVPPKFGDKE